MQLILNNNSDLELVITEIQKLTNHAIEQSLYRLEEFADDKEDDFEQFILELDELSGYLKSVLDGDADDPIIPGTRKVGLRELVKIYHRVLSSSVTVRAIK